jgi:hypothetical protein
MMLLMSSSRSLIQVGHKLRDCGWWSARAGENVSEERKNRGEWHQYTVLVLENDASYISLSVCMDSAAGSKEGNDKTVTYH